MQKSWELLGFDADDTSDHFAKSKKR
jgi:hypothetical protein